MYSIRFPLLSKRYSQSEVTLSRGFELEALSLESATPEESIKKAMQKIKLYFFWIFLKKTKILIPSP